MAFSPYKEQFRVLCPRQAQSSDSTAAEGRQNPSIITPLYPREVIKRGAWQVGHPEKASSWCTITPPAIPTTPSRRISR